MDKLKTALVVIDDTDLSELSCGVLENLKYRTITATKLHEARLKYENEKFHLILIDMRIKGIHAKEFLEGIRRKETSKNIKNLIPFLVIGDKSDAYVKDFAMFDYVNYLEAPYSDIELKKKLLTFTGHSKVISNNTQVIKKDEYLITEGGTSHEMYWVLSGSFLITKMNSDENNIIIGEVHPGELVGEMSFLDSLPRSASVRALEDSEVLVIPHKKFIDVLDHQPRWFRSLMQTMSSRLREANQKIARKMVDVDEADEKGKEES